MVAAKIEGVKYSDVLKISIFSASARINLRFKVLEKEVFKKREFMEHLDTLSNWDKTGYYCLSHSIHKCKTGERLTFSAKMNDHVGVAPNAGKVKARYLVAKRETSNNRAVSKKEIVFFKDKITNLLEFVKQFLKKS